MKRYLKVWLVVNIILTVSVVLFFGIGIFGSDDRFSAFAGVLTGIAMFSWIPFGVLAMEDGDEY